MDVGQVVTSSSYMNYSSSEAKDAKYFLNGDDNEVKSSELVAVGDIVEAYENDNGDVETVVVSRYTVAKIDKVDTDVSTAESRNGASEVLTLTDLDGDNSNDYYDKYDDAEKTLRGYASSYDEGHCSGRGLPATASSAMKSWLLTRPRLSPAKSPLSVRTRPSPWTAPSMSLPATRTAPMVSWTASPATSTSTKEVHHLPDRRRLCHRCGGAAGADLNDVYYVTGVYCEESRYNANKKFTWYAQAVSLADGSAL